EERAGRHARLGEEADGAGVEREAADVCELAGDVRQEERARGDAQDVLAPGQVEACGLDAEIVPGEQHGVAPLFGWCDAPMLRLPRRAALTSRKESFRKI